MIFPGQVTCREPGEPRPEYPGFALCERHYYRLLGEPAPAGEERATVQVNPIPSRTKDGFLVEPVQRERGKIQKPGHLTFETQEDNARLGEGVSSAPSPSSSPEPAIRCVAGCGRPGTPRHDPLLQGEAWCEWCLWKIGFPGVLNPSPEPKPEPPASKAETPAPARKPRMEAAGLYCSVPTCAERWTYNWPPGPEGRPMCEAHKATWRPTPDLNPAPPVPLARRARVRPFNLDGKMVTPPLEQTGGRKYGPPQPDGYCYALDPSAVAEPEPTSPPSDEERDALSDALEALDIPVLSKAKRRALTRRRDDDPEYTGRDPAIRGQVVFRDGRPHHVAGDERGPGTPDFSKWWKAWGYDE